MVNLDEPVYALMASDEIVELANSKTDLEKKLLDDNHSLWRLVKI